MKPEDARKLAMEHAWKWFQHHATQRLTTFNFFVILFAGLCASFSATLQSNRPEISAGIAFLAVLFSVLFKLLDVRNSHLIKLGEASLVEQEKKLSDILNDTKLCIVKQAGIRPKFVFSFRQVFNIVFLVAGIAAFSALLVALSMATNPAQRVSSPTTVNGQLHNP